MIKNEVLKDHLQQPIFFSSNIISPYQKSSTQKKYHDAIVIFEKVNKLESERERKELTYYYLGRSYFAVGKNEDALKMMSKSYEIFHELFKIDEYESESDIKYFIILTNEYIHLLSKIGRENSAKSILNERNELLSKKGYNIKS